MRGCATVSLWVARTRAMEQAQLILTLQDEIKLKIDLAE